MKEAGLVIIGATLTFAAIAWQAGTPAVQTECAEDASVIRYLPVPEVEPVRPMIVAEGLLQWPKLEEEQAVEVADDEPEHRSRHRHRRHWRRRH